MLWLENNTTFSGADITVFAYKNISDLMGRGENTTQPLNTSMSDDMDYGERDNFIISKLEDSQIIDSGKIVNTKKVNRDYIDIVKTGSDQAALNLAKEYQLARETSKYNKNKESKGKFLNQTIVELGSLYSLTFSSFREKVAIRTLGRVSPKGYTRGQRTIAGSLNFTVFQSHELMDFLRPNSSVVLLDQLPKFNLMLVMMNEYGGASIMHIFGVEISSESQQMSVEDLALMDSVSFYAEDTATLENIGNLFDTSLTMLHPSEVARRSLQFISNTGNVIAMKDLYTMGSVNNGNNHVQNLLNSSRGLF